MGRGINQLSATAVKALRRPGWHTDGGGLYIRVRDTGSRTFVFVCTKGGTRRDVTIGSLDEITLAAAREERDRLKRGEPLEEAAPQITNFGEWADVWVAEQEPGWRNAVHRRQRRQTFTKQAKSLRPLGLHEVDTDAVLRVLRPIWTTHNETASRIRGRIERVLDAAKAKGLIKSPWENPARWRGHLSYLLPPRRKLSARGHQAALPYQQVPLFISHLRNRQATSARALEFCILGANRTGEVIGARKSEIDRLTRIWTIPGERMKMGVEHRVPLTPRMLEILAEMRIDDLDDEDLIFQGQSDAPLSNMAMMSLMKRMGHADVTVHGFRSAFRDWAGEETEHAESIAEAALAHSRGNSTVRAYRRGDSLERRRRLMIDWATFACGHPAPGRGRKIAASLGAARKDFTT